MDKSNAKIWIARVLVAVVFFFNVQCAVQFIAWPEAYTYAYQLSGESAEAIIRGFGICFLMWNVTYPPVIAAPQRYRVLFAVVIVQQLIGLVGESLLLASIGPEAGLVTLAASITRFIAFDAAGAVLLIAAFVLSKRAIGEES